MSRSLVLMAVLSLCVAGCTDVTQSDEYLSLEAQLDESQVELSEKEAQLEQVVAELAENSAELEATKADLIDAQADLASAEDEIAQIMTVEDDADLADQVGLSDISDETLLLTIASYPEIPWVRLVLAERYYEEGDYRSAFPHYLVVAESPNATSEEAVTAVVRLGWMAWEGNGEVELAIDLLDEALVLEPDSTEARYLKAQVLWCGAGDLDQAASLLEEVLAVPELSKGSRDQIEADLESIGSGAGCG